MAIFLRPVFAASGVQRIKKKKKKERKKERKKQDENIMVCPIT